MGWVIHIEGDGPFSDGMNASSSDADAWARRFVDQLTAQGHSIKHATITCSKAQSLLGERKPEP